MASKAYKTEVVKVLRREERPSNSVREITSRNYRSLPPNCVVSPMIVLAKPQPFKTLNR